MRCGRENPGGREYLSGREICGREMMRREEVGGRFVGGQSPMSSSEICRLVSARA